MDHAPVSATWAPPVQPALARPHPERPITNGTSFSMRSWATGHSLPGSPSTSFFTEPCLREPHLHPVHPRQTHWQGAGLPSTVSPQICTDTYPLRLFLKTKMFIHKHIQKHTDPFELMVHPKIYADTRIHMLIHTHMHTCSQTHAHRQHSRTHRPTCTPLTHLHTEAYAHTHMQTRI